MHVTTECYYTLLHAEKMSSKHVCVCIYLYICIHVCMVVVVGEELSSFRYTVAELSRSFRVACVGVHVSYLSISISVTTAIYICTYTHIHSCMHACMHAYIHTYELTYMHTYMMHAYIHTYINTQKQRNHTYLHTMHAYYTRLSNVYEYLANTRMS